MRNKTLETMGLLLTPTIFSCKVRLSSE